MVIQSALIVDDSKLARVTLRKKLIRHGVEADLAESAEEAMQKIQSSRPHIVFMDHLMPDTDGFEATRIIRQMPGMENLPIIMCTGKDHEGYLEEAQAIGANSILGKPPTEESLAAILAMDFDSQLTPQAQTSDKQNTVTMEPLDEEPLTAHIDEEQLTANKTDASLPDDIESLLLDAERLTATSHEGEMHLSVALDDADHIPLPEVNLTDDVDVGNKMPSHHAVSEMAPAQSTLEASIPEESWDDLLPENVSIENDEASEAETTIVDNQRLMALIDQQLAACKDTLQAELFSSLSKDLASQMASQPSTLSVEDINTLVKMRIQTLWKKNALAVNEKVAHLKQQIDRVDTLTKTMQADQQAEAIDHASKDDYEWMEQKIRSLESQLARTSSSASIAKQIGFTAFVMGTSAVAYLVAKLFHFI